MCSSGSASYTKPFYCPQNRVQIIFLALSLSTAELKPHWPVLFAVPGLGLQPVFAGDYWVLLLLFMAVVMVFGVGQGSCSSFSVAMVIRSAVPQLLQALWDSLSTPVTDPMPSFVSALRFV